MEDKKLLTSAIATELNCVWVQLGLPNRSVLSLSWLWLFDFWQRAWKVLSTSWSLKPYGRFFVHILGFVSFIFLFQTLVKFLFVQCVYVCACLCVCMCAFRCKCTCVHVWRLEVTIGYFPQFFSSLFFRQGLSVHMELIDSSNLPS